MSKIFTKSLEIAFSQFPDWQDDRRCLHFSFLYERTKLICMAQNTSKTHTKNLYNLKNFDIAKKGGCAELILARRSRKFSNLNWNRLTLVNVRINYHGEVKNSHPCPSCRNLLAFISPKNIYYSTDLGDFEKFNLE